MAKLAAGPATRAAWPQLWNLLLNRRVDEMTAQRSCHGDHRVSTGAGLPRHR
ncbi:hypothetical protein ACI2K4_09530 [Micromonospora sp. NPDC050397]|uniref:hypothetical protein n=1 Tax=Micromonospora sp. NPDC050397 TaxID=3364279 RepID=UPI00384A735D